MQTNLKHFITYITHPVHYTGRMVTGLILLNLLVIALAAFNIYEDKHEHEMRARTNTQNLALLLSRDAGSVFDRSDLVLRTMVDEIEKQLATGNIQSARLNTFLDQQQSHLPESISLRVTDAKGLVRYGQGLPEGKPIDLSDREHFMRQRDNPNIGMAIAQPVLARISRQWSIPLSRRINRPDGSFAGIVYINIPVAYFVKKFASLDLGTYGLVALRATSNVSMARFPETQQGGGAIGQVAISEQLRTLLKNNPESVTYVAPSPADHIERIYTYQKLSDYPLYMIAGQATQDVLQEWLRDTYQTAALLALFSLSTMMFAWLLARSWRRQLATSETLRENEQRWSFALESGNFAVWDWNIQDGKVQLSKLGKQLFGFDESEIGDNILEWAARCHPDDVDHVVEKLKDHYRHRDAAFSAEFRVRCEDSSWKWIHSRGLVVERAADGRPLRMIGLHSDISERKQREEELRLSSTVFAMADEAMLVTDAQNSILSVNPAFTAITGYELQEVIGRNPRLLSANTHPKEFYQQMWATLLETGAWAGEVLNRKKNGEAYVEWLSIKRVINDRGELTHHVAVFSDITERKAAEKRMHHLALHDALTDLPNRTLLTERLEQAILRTRRDKTRLGLLYFDLDKFKPVNDTYGHEVGDWLLKAVAERILTCVRESDTVARLGGDEFVVLLSTIEQDMDALAVGEKIRAALAQPFMFAEANIEISTSMGVAICPEHGTDATTLTRNADTAMYHAKKDGRNRVELYQEDMEQE